MNLLRQLISDGEMPSTMRVLVLIVVVPVMIVWTVLSIKTGQFIVPDAKIIGLLISALGAKSLQSFAERPQVSTPVSQPSIPAVTDAPSQKTA